MNQYHICCLIQAQLTATPTRFQNIDESYMLSPPMGLRLDVAGALLTKRVPRFALPSTTIYDDSDIEVYQRPTILERVWLL